MNIPVGDIKLLGDDLDFADSFQTYDYETSTPYNLGPYNSTGGQYIHENISDFHGDDFFSNSEAPSKNDENDKSMAENMAESASGNVDDDDSDKNDDFLKINDFLSKHNDEEGDNKEDKEEQDTKNKPKVKFY